MASPPLAGASSCTAAILPLPVSSSSSGFKVSAFAISRASSAPTLRNEPPLPPLCRPPPTAAAAPAAGVFWRTLRAHTLPPTHTTCLFVAHTASPMVNVILGFSWFWTIISRLLRAMQWSWTRDSSYRDSEDVYLGTSYAVFFSGAMNDFFVFNVSAMKWTNMVPIVRGQLPSPRFSHGLILLGGSIYVFGGQNSSGAFWFTCTTFGENRNRCTSFSEPPCLHVCMYWSRIFHRVQNVKVKPIFSGITPTQNLFKSHTWPVWAGFLNDLYVLNNSMIWKEIISIQNTETPSPRASFGFASTNDNIYVHGGSSFKNGKPI